MKRSHFLGAICALLLFIPYTASAVPMQVDFTGTITEIRYNLGNVFGADPTISGSFFFDTEVGAPPDTVEPEPAPDEFEIGNYRYSANCCSNAEPNWVTATVTVNGKTYSIDTNGLPEPSPSPDGRIFNSNVEQISVEDGLGILTGGRDEFSILINEYDAIAQDLPTERWITTDQAYLRVNVGSTLVDFINGDGLLQEFTLDAVDIADIDVVNVGLFRWRDNVETIGTTGNEPDGSYIADGTAFFTITSLSWRQVSTPVSIDIKPGSDPVCNGVTPVAIFGSDTLDVIQIDQTTLSFEGKGARERGNGALSCNIRDANSDGYDDLVCQYEDTTTEGTLTGELLDGTPIEGTDTFCL